MNENEITKEYYDLVFKYLLTLTGFDVNLSEELTQETFLRAIQKIDTFREESKITTWLCQIAKHTFYQSLDKKKRRKEVSLEEAVDVEANSLIEERLLEEEGKLRIYKEIQKLPSPMKDIVMLRVTGDLSFKEISEILSCKESYARVTFFRAKQILEKELSDNE